VRHPGVRLDAGKYSFRSNDKRSVVDLDVKAGQPYYIRVELVPGLLKGHGRLMLMPKEQGAAEAHRLKPLDSGKVRDSGRVFLEPLP
jgi:hypothetical protein